MNFTGADRKRFLALLVPGVVLALWLVLGAVLGWAMLYPGQKVEMVEAVEPIIESHGTLVLAWWLLLAGLAAWVVARFHERHVEGPARLADATRTLAGDAAAPDLPLSEGATRSLAEAINALAAQRRALSGDMARLVEDASRSVAEQRDQLAALMSELEQSVVVCNLEGRILLYNARAQVLFRRLASSTAASSASSPARAGDAPVAGDGAPAQMAAIAQSGSTASSQTLLGQSLLGLGRSIHNLIDPAYIEHARAEVERRIARGEMPASAHFVITTPSGDLLQVNMAPVRPATAEHGVQPKDGGALSGFVLLLDDITAAHEANARRDRRLLELTEASRASFASMQVALDMLDYPDLDSSDRERFLAIVRDEVRAMSARLSLLTADAAREVKSHWPLQSMPGCDLVTILSGRIHAVTGVDVDMQDIDASLWLSVDSFALAGAFVFLARRLEAECPGLPVQIRLSPAHGRVHLDLAWPLDHRHDAELAAEKLTMWLGLPMREGASLTVRDVAERHDGEVWLEQDAGRGRAFFRFLLPEASGDAVDLLSPADSRPEYYDFALLSARPVSHDLDTRPLTELDFTVFDTETTGLDPRGGDEILQIGATRILNGRILRGESFDQLVDPGRSIPEAGIAVHGVTPAIVRGQPAIGEVLPRFRAYVADTVLVGHNVAFDMRFLKLKEAATGIVFDRPVLDTLLLASIVWPNEDAHGLEAMAGRLGISVSDRHRALGDALVTAELFLKLIPLLAQRGIHTLAEARRASEDSYYARLNY